MKNKKGFTLVELLGVLVLIIVIMLLIVPNLKKLMNQNEKQQYETYETMMIEYTKAFPNYDKYEYICLEDLGMAKINQNIKCNGYVKINNLKIESFISCFNKNNENLYITDGYNTNLTGCNK